MLRELLTIFRDNDPLGEMGAEFMDMLRRCHELAQRGGEIFFGKEVDPEEPSRIPKLDVRINKLQRKIRKRVITHLSVSGNSQEVPYGLLLMSLVKDAERIGDYVKDLCDLRPMIPGGPPDDAVTEGLRRVHAKTESLLEASSNVFEKSDRDRAIDLIRQGREVLDQCDTLIDVAARTPHEPAVHTALVLAIQYERRMAGHVLNILSSVVVPLHRLDYYDEKDFVRDPA